MTMPTLDPGPFRDMAAAMRIRGGFNGQLLKFVKGVWKLGRNGVDVLGHSFVTRPDWAMHGWTKWWDRKIVDYRIGYIADRYKPPIREQLGDDDRDLWDIWCGGRDPWGNLQWHLPMFNAVSNEQLLWTTDTMGGCDALAALLNAFADRLAADPADGKILPIVELDSDTYHHPTRGAIAVPLFNIVGYAVMPTTPRPPLPVAPAPRALPSPASKEAEAEAGTSDIAALLDDDIPY
jgi:hypothetical protein